MKAKNEMRISFPSSSNNEAFGRAVVAAFAAQLDPTIDELSDIKTAVSEAVTNCIVHAYRDTIGMIYINAKYDDRGTLQIKIRDKGCGIEDVEQAMQEGYSTAGQTARELGFGAGMGLPNMKRYSDEMTIDTEVGKGTTVTVKIKVS